MDSSGHDKRRCVFLSLRCVALARPLVKIELELSPSFGT
jgi:hypothetical protein